MSGVTLNQENIQTKQNNNKNKINYQQNNLGKYNSRRINFKMFINIYYHTFSSIRLFIIQFLLNIQILFMFYIGVIILILVYFLIDYLNFPQTKKQNELISFDVKKLTFLNVVSVFDIQITKKIYHRLFSFLLYQLFYCLYNNFRQLNLRIFSLQLISFHTNIETDLFSSQNFKPKRHQMDSLLKSCKKSIQESKNQNCGTKNKEKNKFEKKNVQKKYNQASQHQQCLEKSFKEQGNLFEEQNKITLLNMSGNINQNQIFQDPFQRYQLNLNGIQILNKQHKFQANSSDEEQQKQQISKKIQLYDELRSDRVKQYLNLMDQQELYSKIKTKDANLSLQIHQANLQNRFELEKLFEENQIIVFKNQQPYPSIKIHNIIQHADYQIVELDVRVGRFEKTVRIYNVLQQSCFHSIKPFTSGSFGKIYLWSYLEREFIVKCVAKTSKNTSEQFENSKEKQYFFKQILKQYMIAFIAGVLEVGPKVVNPFGFDLIVSKKCIQFFLERCMLPEYYLTNVHERFSEIKQSLFKLHILNIVHNDIKPENIMFNPRTNKLFFIDFGLSEFLQRPIGFKKTTKFIGTYQYSSPQMQKLLFENNHGNIDLYYNDAYSLNSTLNKLFQIQKREQKIEQNPSSPTGFKIIQNFLNKVYLKFFILTQEAQKAITLGNIINLKSKLWLQEQVLLFMLKFKYCPKLKRFYHECIDQVVREKEKFKKLNQTYIKNIALGNLWCQQKDQNQNYKDFKTLYQNFQNMQNQIQGQQTSFKQSFITKDQKKKILMEINSELADQKVWELYLDFINFLKKNQTTSLYEKYQVSEIMLKKYKIIPYFCVNSNPQIYSLFQPIFEFLYFLLKYCSTQPFNRWKRKYFIQILSLMMLLGWDVPSAIIEDWKHVFCISQLDEADLLKNFLQFQFLEQISTHRYFKIYNKNSVKQIDNLLINNRNGLNPNQNRRPSLYHYFLEQRKLQKNKMFDQTFLNLINNLLESDQNPEIISEERLNLLQKQIEKLSYSNFHNKEFYHWIKSQLFFWVYLRYQKLRINNQKQLSILQKIKNNSRLIKNRQQIDTYHFQLVMKYGNLKNSYKLRQQLNYIDKIIDCPLISEKLCVSMRLMLNFLLKDAQKFQVILNTVESQPIKQTNDMFLLYTIIIIYQNIFSYSFGYDSNQEFIYVFRKIMELKIHKFICFFHQNKIMRSIQKNRLIFSHILSAVIKINYEKGQHESVETLLKDNVLVKNRFFYLNVYQRLCCEFQELEIFKSYITSKMLILGNQRNYKQAYQTFQNQNRIKIEDLRISNAKQAGILINYYCYKGTYDKYNQFYTNKIVQIFYELLNSGYHNFIISNYRLLMYMIQQINQRSIMFIYLKILTENMSSYPSKLNVEILVIYMKKIFRSIYCRFIQNVEKDPHSLQFNLSKYQNAIQELRNYLKDFYYFIKQKIGFSKMWQNPYMMIISYFFGIYGAIGSKQMRKLNRLIVNLLAYTIYQAKQFILDQYYWYFWRNQVKQINSDRKANLILKMHLNHTKTAYDFEKLIQIKINNRNYDEISHYPGYNNVRNKIYKYYDNLDVIKKVNYLQRSREFLL